jgi:superfamily II DNA or RNA helicase
MSRPCGIKKSPKNNAYTKEELVDIAVSKGLKKNKTQAKQLSLNELCTLLGLSADVSSRRVSSRRVSSRRVSSRKAPSRRVSSRRVSSRKAPSRRVSSRRVSSRSVSSRRVSSSDKNCIDRSNLSLKKHQIKVINFIKKDKHKGLLVVHSTGSGKTITAVTASQCYLDKYPHHKIIIITPTSLQENFKKEMISYGIISFSSYEFYTIQGFYFETKRNTIDCSNSFFILDEAHNLRTDINENAHTGLYANALLNCAKKANKVLLLTATPFVNSENDIVNLMEMIGVPDSKKRLSDPEKYFKCHISVYSPPSKEIEKHYPKTTDHDVFLTMTPSYYKKYMSVERNNITEESIDDLFNGNIKMFYNGVRRASNSLEKENSPKVNWIIDKVQQYPDEKFLIFSHWLDAGIHLLTKRLENKNIPYGFIIGELSVKERDDIVQSYNRGDIKILLVSKAGSEGLDLKLTNKVIIMEPSWNESTHLQIIGRAVRYTSHVSLPREKRHVDIYRLYMIKPDENKLKPYLIEKNSFKNDYDNALLSVDFYLRNMSIHKQRKIDKMMRILKHSSIEKNEC